MQQELRRLAPWALVLVSACRAAGEAGEASEGRGAVRGAAAAPAASAASADPAQALARATIARMGGIEAWDETRFLHWRFFGKREHWWDKATGDVRIDTGDTLVLMNVETRAGRAWKDGAEVVEPAELAELLEAGYAWWVNDSYWLVMPFKLLDPGVRLALRGAAALPDGRPAQVLELTFDGVGLTPENRYEVYVADATGLIERWAFYAKASDTTPALESEWSGWQRFGQIWLATGHGRGADWDVWVADELPRALFTSPDRPKG